MPNCYYLAEHYSLFYSTILYRKTFSEKIGKVRIIILNVPMSMKKDLVKLFKHRPRVEHAFINRGDREPKDPSFVVNV